MSTKEDKNDTTQVPKNHGKPWSPKDKTKLNEYLKSNKSLEKIASKLGRSTTSVNLKIKNIARSRIHKNDDPDEIMKDLNISEDEFNTIKQSMIPKRSNNNNNNNTKEIHNILKYYHDSQTEKFNLIFDGISTTNEKTFNMINGIVHSVDKISKRLSKIEKRLAKIEETQSST